jgi:hypothetical protein
VGSHQQASRTVDSSSNPNTSNTPQPFSAAAATSKSDPVPALDRGRGNTAHVRRLRRGRRLSALGVALRGLRTTTTDQSDADDQTGHSHHNTTTPRPAGPHGPHPVCHVCYCYCYCYHAQRLVFQVAVETRLCNPTPVKVSVARYNMPWPAAVDTLLHKVALAAASTHPLSVFPSQSACTIPVAHSASPLALRCHCCCHCVLYRLGDYLPTYLPTYLPAYSHPPTHSHPRCLSNTASFIKLKFHPSPRPRHHQPTLPRLHVANPDDLPPKYTPIPHYLFSRPSQA